MPHSRAVFCLPCKYGGKFFPDIRRGIVPNQGIGAIGHICAPVRLGPVGKGVRLDGILDLLIVLGCERCLTQHDHVEQQGCQGKLLILDGPGTSGISVL